ncbi:unnamed protein product [Parajaminaea phylloscopi]
MRFLTLLVAIVAIFPAIALAQADDTPELKVTTTFPNNPLSLVKNGQANRVVFSIANPRSADRVLSLTGVTGAWLNSKKQDGQRGRVLRNMTVTTFKKEMSLKTLSGRPLEVPFDFYPEFKPQNMDVEFRLLLKDGQTSKKHNVVAYQGSVTVIEPAKSWFDIQTWSIYLFGLALLGGAAFWAKEQYLPSGPAAKKRTSANLGASSRTSAGKPASSPSTPSGLAPSSQGYDEDWIPAGHIKKAKASGLSSGDEGRKSPVGGSRRRK